jgi:hypothetical protein
MKPWNSRYFMSSLSSDVTSFLTSLSKSASS